MLRKLMKHEFRATGRIMLPLFLIVLVTAVGANLSTRTLLENSNNFINLLGTLLLIAFAIATGGVCVVAFALMLQRFYKNLLQDEGYVMMTLPVSVHHHVWSKLLVSIVWYVATAAVVVLAFVVLMFDVEFAGRLIEEIRYFFGLFRINAELIHEVFVGIELVILMFVAGAAACLQFYAALTAGHSFANRKMLLSVAFYFGGQFVLQLLGGTALILLEESDLEHLIEDMSLHAAIHLSLVAAILIASLFGAVFYFLTAYFLKRRLNLE